jgi:anti-sigma factor RsiW
MNCSRQLIEAYMDEELDPDLRAAVEEHLSTCQDCSEVHARLREQKAGIKLAAPYYTAPVAVERAVRESLRRAAADEAGARGQDTNWRWLAIAASILLAASLAWNVSRLRPGIAENDLVAQGVLSDHIRSLMGEHLLDVPSTDQHTVKPWFNGKLDFSPDVKDFAAEGFPLVGGRLDYLMNRTVAALVYRRRQHVINLFTWPSGSSAVEESPFSRNGYNVVHWTQGGMNFWAVSDLARNELEQFRDLYRK